MAVQLNDREVKEIKRSGIYDKGTLRVVALACFSITIAVFFMGAASYRITEHAVLDKLKNQDLYFILESIASKVDGRIARAKETSLMMAEDPFLQEWVKIGQNNAAMTELSKQKTRQIAEKYDYNTTFVVSALTREYWSESGYMDKVSPENPEDAWFFDTIQSRERISINIDYNKERGNTYVFINTLMGDLENPIAVTGVGLDLKDMAEEFHDYKFGEGGSLWLVDRQGVIHMGDDLNDRGKNILNLLPGSVSHDILEDVTAHLNTGILEYRNEENELIDTAYQAVESADWLLVLQVPRAETVGFLTSIQFETLMTSLFALIVVSFVFYWLSQRVANPLRRAIQLGKEMEKQVEQRTQELKEQNIKIMDSIEYAKRVQETIIPSEALLAEAFRESFVLWQPRDKVGGDFYWLKKINQTWILAIGDCTGHGVPGALMTMAVIPMLDHVTEEIMEYDPAVILNRLNRMMKASFQKKDSTADDGADIGVCVVQNGEITFAGAKISLYRKTENGVQTAQGNRHSIGYRRSNDDYRFTTHHIPVLSGDTFYLVTDGLFDQNGGTKDYSFGKKRFVSLLEQFGDLPLSDQRNMIGNALEEYMQGNAQRDDMTLWSFRV